MTNVFTKIKFTPVVLFIFLRANTVLAQTKADIFDTKIKISWLGLDYTHTKYIPAQENVSNFAPEVPNDDLLHKYIPSWNHLFLSQTAKFDVAKAIHHPSVLLAMDVTEKANNAINGLTITNKQADFKTFTEQNLGDYVKGYDFKGNTGIGLLFFVETMDRETETEGLWVTFVNMDTKTVLFTAFETGKTAGMGFRNNWADATYKILLTIWDDYFSWKKQAK